MYKLTLFLGICSAFASGRKITIPAEDSEKMVGCYFLIKEPYNDPQAQLEEKGIDVSLCSHLFYSFAGIGLDGSILDDILVENLDSGEFQHFDGLRKKNPHIKTLVRIADLNNASSDNSVHVLTDPLLRGKVVDNVVNFVKKYSLDGIDIDLSNMQVPLEPHIDEKNLILSLKVLKEIFDKEGFILSVSVDPREDIAQKLYDIKGISTYVSFVNLLAFNLYGIFENGLQGKKLTVGHTSPLFQSLKENAEGRKKNIDYVVRYWIQNGAPANKLILGTAFNSELSYTLANPKQIGRGAPFIDEGKYSCLKYSQICALSKKPGWKYFYDQEQQGPYLYNGNQLITYDDVDSVKAKAEYVNKMKLGGAVVQYVDQDDIDGKCGEKFALLKTLNRVLRNKP